MDKAIIYEKPDVIYDSKSDVLYFAISKGIEEEFIEITPGVYVEIDEQGKVIGIEILKASEVLQPVSKSLVKQLASNK